MKLSKLRTVCPIETDQLFKMLNQGLPLWGSLKEANGVANMDLELLVL